MNPNTPIHEYTHIWADAMIKNNPKGWESIVKLLKGTPVWNEVVADANYANIKDNDDQVASETLSRLSGRNNAAKMEAMAQQLLDEGGNDSVKKSRARKLLDRMRKALQEFWSWVGKELFGIEKFDNIDEVTDRVLYDLVSGTDLGAVPEGIRMDQQAQERAEIERKAKENGTWLKAPNGEDTNLTTEQWVTVRTKAFKDWFGDWEKVFRIERLRGSESIAIPENAYEGKYELNQVSAEKYIKDNLRGEYRIEDTGEYVKLTNRSAKKLLSHSYNSNAHLQSIIAIPEMIQKAVFIDETSAEKGNARYDSYRYYACGIKIGNEDYTARITIGVKNGAFYYDHALTEIEKGNLIEIAQGFTPSGGRTLPSYAKSKDTRIIPLLQTNSSKIVDANGEPKVVYHQTNAKAYINRETGQNWDELDWRERMEWEERDDWEDYWKEQDFHTFTRVNARTTNEFDGFFFAPGYDEYHEYGNRTIAAFLNIRKPATNKDYNIDSTKNNAGREERIRLQEEGFDGVIREYDGAVDEYIAFEPNQIKLAEGNTTFDPKSDDIRFMADGRAEMERNEPITTDKSFIHAYDGAFDELSSEYDALDKTDEAALKAFRAKKLDLVERYMSSMSSNLAMPTAPVVVDASDIGSVKKAYELLPDEYRKFVTFDAFIDEVSSTVGFYVADSKMSVYNISKNDALNSSREWLGILAHENGHKAVETLGISDSDKEKLWEFCKRTTTSVRKKIEKDYESAAERGEEYLVYTIQSRARYPRLGDLLAECIMGEKTAQDVVKTFKDSLPLRDEIVEKILNYFRDGYRKARGETDYSATAGRAKSKEEVQGFYNRFRGGYSQGLRRDNSIGRDLDDILFNIGDNAEIEESADIEVGEGATLEPGVDPASEKAQKALQRLNKVVRQFRAKLNKVSKENLDWGKSVAEALESEVGSGELLSFLEMSDFISNIRGAISEKSVDKALEALSDKVLTKLIAERRKNLDKLLKVEVQRTTPAGIPIAHGVDNATRQVVDTFNAIKRLGAEQVRKYMEEISDKDMPGHLKAEVMQLHTLWALIQDAEVHLEVLEQKKTRAHEESVAWYRVARELKGVKGKEKEREKALAARRTHLAEIRRIEPLLTETKQQLADDYASLVEQFADRIMVGRGARKRKIEAEREYARRFGIEAWKDVETGRDRRTYEYSAEEKRVKKKRERILDIRLSMHGSLKYMIESVSINAIGGRGFIYREMIEGDNGWVACRDNELKMNLDCDTEILERAKKAGFKTVDDMRRAFDERLLMSDGTQVIVTYKTERTGSVREERVPLTVGNATYLVLMWNQPDIRPTLEKMNIDEGTITEINEMLPAYAKNFIEWSVDMLEQRLENVYSPASVQMYGTSMDKNLNYFPVRRVKEDTYHAPVDITDPNAIPDDNKKVVNTSTALIRRKANLVSVEILVNPMEVLGKHLEEMNHFASFVPFARNANILLSAPGFREQLDMQEGRGHGLNTYDNFKQAVLVAAGNYQPKTGDIDRIMCEVQGMIAAGKISWRFFTAAKQILSLPAFVSYTTDRKYLGILAKNILTTAWWKRGESGRMATWRWCYENLPTFRERWDSKYAGDEKLSTIEATAMARALDRSMAGRAIRDFFGKYGMLANAAVDAFTCSIGAYSIYEYELQRYQKEEGMSKEEADKMAKRRAEIGFNQSQQSSELMFLAPSQLDRTFAATYASLFENSNRAYGRIERVAGEQIVRSFDKEAVKKQLDLATQRYAKKMRDADRARLRAENEKISDFSQRLSEEQIEEVVNTKRGEFDIEARKKAEADMARAKKNAVSDVVVFRYLLNILWGIAPSLALSVAFIGSDDDENPESWDWKFLAMHLLQARLRNGVGGATIGSIINGFGVQSMLESDLNKLADTASEIFGTYKDGEEEKVTVDWQGLWVTAKLVISMGIGVNIDTFISMYNAVRMVIYDGSLDAEDVAMFLNSPKSIIEMAAIRPDEGESQEDYIKRIAFMKHLANEAEAAKKKQEINREGIVEELTNTDKSALTNLKKWQKNYIDIKTARALGLKWERNRYNGRVEIPELKALDEKYNEMLDSLNLTQGLAKKAKEKRYLYPEAVQRKMNADKERLSVMKRLRNIQGLEKGRELNVVKNSDYEALTRQWYDAKRSLVEDWYNR